MKRRNFFGVAALAVFSPWVCKSQPSFMARNLATGAMQNQLGGYDSQLLVEMYRRLYAKYGDEPHLDHSEPICQASTMQLNPTHHQT